MGGRLGFPLQQQDPAVRRQQGGNGGAGYPGTDDGDVEKGGVVHGGDIVPASARRDLAALP
jgi:hypothetical protein